MTMASRIKFWSGLVVGAALTVASAILSPSRALAWDGNPSGTVAAIELDVWGNFNVSLNGAPGQIMCKGAANNNPSTDGWYMSHAIAYTDRGTADGLKRTYASLLAAQLSGKNVTLYTTNLAITYTDSTTGQTRQRTECIIGAMDVW
jgi:hypothetical protein